MGIGLEGKLDALQEFASLCFASLSFFGFAKNAKKTKNVVVVVTDVVVIVLLDHVLLLLQIYYHAKCGGPSFKIV